MQTIALSEAALALFRRRISGERVEVADDNRALYRELAAAGLMEPQPLVYPWQRWPLPAYRGRGETASRHAQRPRRPPSICLSSSLAAWLTGRLFSGPAMRANSWSPPYSCSASS